MTIKLLPTLALVSAFFISGSIFAENKKADNPNVKPPVSASQNRDAASGMATGKRQHKPFSTTKPVDKSSPLLANPQIGSATKAHGLPTGKRQHKPVSVTKQLDKASPQMIRSAYRKCPDGTMINPGEKCPEKSGRAGYKLCPDGSMINPGQKCPTKSNRAIKQR